MAKLLHLNSSAIYADYVSAMEKCIDSLLDIYYEEVYSALATSAGRNDLEKIKLSGEEYKMLKRQLVGGPHAIMDSFGTGSLMDTSNPSFDDYAGGESYNPARERRPGAPITGRPEGQYTNIFGETEYSSGRLEGANLEKFPGSPIKPKAPSYAFQNAEKWFMAGDRAKKEISKFTSEFFTQVRNNPGKYFRFY